MSCFFLAGVSEKRALHASPLALCEQCILLVVVSKHDWTNLTPRPAWRVKAGSRLVFNGSEINQTHLIRWVRGGHCLYQVWAPFCCCDEEFSSPMQGEVLSREGMINPTARLRLTRMMGGIFPIAGKDWPLAEDVACPASIAPYIGEG